MKPLLLYSLIQLIAYCGLAQLEVNGSSLTFNDQEIILRGINVGICEDGTIDLSNTTQVYAYIDEIAMTGANSLRFTWYTDGVSWRDGGQYVNGDPNPQACYHKGNGTVMRDYLDDGHLSAIFTYCRSKNMIPILSIHDLTCLNDWNYFANDLTDWWTKPSVLNFLEEHKNYMILNVANEFGHINYQGGGLPHFNQFQSAYSTFISTMRNAGVTVPIMIDAPDCGQSSSELIAMSDALLSVDPLENIIYSTHGYWSDYAPNEMTITTKLDEMVASNKCFVFGEIANRQAGPPNYCGEIDISNIYPLILNGACEREIGWMAWVWNQDCEAQREMSNTSTFDNLTNWGDDIVNNPNYGLKAQNGCGALQLELKSAELIENQFFRAYPNPAKQALTIDFISSIGEEIKLVDLYGQTVILIMNKTKLVELNIEHLKAGIYFIQIDGEICSKLVKQ